jgi:hypothetical protein
MLNMSIDQITEIDLQGLIDNSVIEWKTLDYKAVLPGNSDSDKKEFLADVSSLANSIGGDIVFGIICDNSTGTPKTLEGISATNWDQEILRLDNMIRDGVKPRISGIKIKLIPLSSGKSALVVRTEKSWNPPHRVTFKGHDKFYGRSTNGKYALDVDELRNAFNLSATIAERIRNFRIDRVNKILADDTPVRLLSLPKTVLHIVPLISLNPGQIYDITVVYKSPSKLPTINSIVGDRRYNLDGVLTYSVEMSGQYYAYVQLFKNGIIEATNASMLEPSKDGLSIPGALFESQLMQSLSAYLALMNELSVESPAYIFLSVLGVKGYKMETSERRMFQVPLIDRDHLLVPEAIVHSYDTEAKDILRPCFDSVWNACGYSRSLCYDENGNWTGNAGLWGHK